MSALPRLAKLGAVAAATAFAYGAVVEVRSFRVRQVCVDILPPGAQKIRILHISDLHLMARQRRKLEFIAALSGLEPDLVVNTGDNLSEPEALEPLMAALGRLRDVPGVFVFGSNDYVGPRPANPLSYLVEESSHSAAVHTRPMPTEALRAAFESFGWTDLVGHRAEYELRGLNLELRGTDDAHWDLDDYGLVAGPPAPGVDVALGVTHAPYQRVLDEMTDDGLNLILAGHTHGGQVCVPGFGALTTNSDLEPSRAKGLSTQETAAGSSWVHVSAGLGTSPYSPYRFACPPEVTVLTLRPAPNG